MLDHVLRDLLRARDNEHSVRARVLHGVVCVRSCVRCGGDSVCVSCCGAEACYDEDGRRGDFWVGGVLGVGEDVAGRARATYGLLDGDLAAVADQLGKFVGACEGPKYQGPFFRDLVRPMCLWMRGMKY